MKTIFVLTCIVAVALAKNLPNLPENERVKLAQVHQSCQSDPKTYCDENKLRNLVNNIDDPVVGTHMLCMAVKAGLIKSNGDFDLETMKNKISLVIDDQSKVDGLVKKCSHKTENSGKTANLMWVCFVQNDIQYYHSL
uniref:Odorant-binding protein 2 n=1 Tax=Pyrrhalta maculicollis TaxID=226885 RepID=A0A1J0KKF7_9CUCU|nr:odorant-binding protein 2 [Pyrrhalta maculicollis]